MLLDVHRDHKGRGAQDGHLDFHTACRFTSTDTIRTVRNLEPRTATPTFTQLPRSAEGYRKVTSGFLSRLRPFRQVYTVCSNSRIERHSLHKQSS